MEALEAVVDICAQYAHQLWGVNGFYMRQNFAFGFHLKRVNLEICCGKLRMKGSLDKTKRTYQIYPLSTPTGVALGIPTTTVPAATMISSTTQVGVHTIYSSSICISHSSAPSMDISTHYLVYLLYPLLLCICYTLSSSTRI